MLNKIWSIDLRIYESFEKIEDKNYIGLGKINFLIGANNTGKSRFMRSLFQSSGDSVITAVSTWSNKFREKLEPILDAVPSNFTGRIVLGKDLHDMVEGKYDLIRNHKDVAKKLLKFSDDLFRYESISDYPEHNYFIAAKREVMKSGGSQHSNFFKASIEQLIATMDLPVRYYVPILRGMRPLAEEKDLFAIRTIQDYFPEAKINQERVVTGYALYDLLAKFLLGKPKERRKIREYEEIIGKEFFGGQEITLIPEYGKDTVAVKIGDDEQFSIYDLGDGLQQVIIITSAAYLNSEESLYFIEEPEICLHPGLLRKLMQFLLNHTAHQYFVTTHSNHVLELAELHSNIVVHRFKKTGSGDTGMFQIRECSKDRDILAELGVHASSVYLANATLWVEGITDRLYISAFLKKYIATREVETEKVLLGGFMENHHYVFVEYQGGTLGHWRFDEKAVDSLKAMSLCSEALVIADGDIRGKGTRVEELQAQLGDRLLVLPGKEIENLLPQEVLKTTAGRLFDGKRDRADFNKLDLEKIKYSDYRASTRGIGHYLDGLLGLDGRGKSRRRFFADESGTIADKVKFCRTAVNVMESVDWSLTPEINSLCEAIFKHIKKNNPIPKAGMSFR